MMCFQQSDSWCLTLALPRVWLVEDEVSVFFPAQQGYGARMREKTFWMPSPYFIWHYRPLLTPPPPARPRLLTSCPLSIPASSLCLCTSPVLMLIVRVHCSLSSLASFLSWSHFLSHTACNYTHIRREEGAWGGRVNVWERRKGESCINMCPFSFILLSQDTGDILPNLPVEKKELPDCFSKTLCS